MNKKEKTLKEIFSYVVKTKEFQTENYSLKFLEKILETAERKNINKQFICKQLDITESKLEDILSLRKPLTIEIMVSLAVSVGLKINFTFE